MNFAIDKAIAILEEKDIFVSSDEIISGIENGVYKLKNNKNKEKGFSSSPFS
ncbi:hypothetical protein [Cytobacillus horneckiae]|uniref:hypothetical protein n=1 Tax=Cytobacillus horneckiae TaxID=549687 RepID=UPI000A73EDB4|nr:hypothetical protein [Cytobacillus horneckiae]MEC1157989.1 hypothetical protein [Cytobacillus horneckiae]MED2937086.1 hypothetical protein [Cytobacillus horneckiae]